MSQFIRYASQMTNITHSRRISSTNTYCGLQNIEKKNDHYSNILFKNEEQANNQLSITLLELLDSIELFSASNIFPTRSQSWSRWSTRIEPLLSKQHEIMVSTWWCKKLLYGYLQHMQMYSIWKQLTS